MDLKLRPGTPDDAEAHAGLVYAWMALILGSPALQIRDDADEEELAAAVRQRFARRQYFFSAREAYKALGPANEMVVLYAGLHGLAQGLDQPPEPEHDRALVLAQDLDDAFGPALALGQKKHFVTAFASFADIGHPLVHAAMERGGGLAAGIRSGGFLSCRCSAPSRELVTPASVAC